MEKLLISIIKEMEDEVRSHYNEEQKEYNNLPEAVKLQRRRNFKKEKEKAMREYVVKLIKEDYQEQIMFLKEESTILSEYVKPIIKELIEDSNPKKPVIRELSQKNKKRIKNIESLIDTNIKTEYNGTINLQEPGIIKRKPIEEIKRLGMLAFGTYCTTSYLAMLTYNHFGIQKTGKKIALDIIMGLLYVPTGVGLMWYSIHKIKSQEEEKEKLPETIRQNIAEQAKYLDEKIQIYNDSLRTGFESLS